MARRPCTRPRQRRRPTTTARGRTSARSAERAQFVSAHAKAKEALARRAAEPAPPHPAGSAEYWKARAENAWAREDDRAMIDLEMDLRLSAIAGHLHVLDGIAKGLAEYGHGPSGETLQRAVDALRRTLAGELPETLPGSQEPEPCPHRGPSGLDPRCQLDARNHYHYSRPIWSPERGDWIEQVQAVEAGSDTDKRLHPPDGYLGKRAH